MTSKPSMSRDITLTAARHLGSPLKSKQSRLQRENSETLDAPSAMVSGSLARKGLLLSFGIEAI
jgi:hypothetical protein